LIFCQENLEMMREYSGGSGNGEGVLMGIQK
jgi:hypothetical protein